MTDIRIHAAERALLFGASGTGKSTLATYLMDEFLKENPKGRIFVADSKPRYRAQFHVNGTKMSYKGWVDGDTLGAPAVAIADEIVKLKQVFAHAPIILFQSYTEKMEHIDDYIKRCADYAQQLFAFASKEQPCLFYIDEFYDVVVGPSGWADARLLHAVRSGRERNLAVMASAQRPKSIPLPILTESQNKYRFWLEYEEDVKYLGKYGIPVAESPTDHQFQFYRRVRGMQATSVIAQLGLGRKDKKAA